MGENTASRTAAAPAVHYAPIDAAAQELDVQDRANVRSAGRPKTLYNENSDVQDLRAPTGTSAAAALRRLHKDHPDIHKRVFAGRSGTTRPSTSLGRRPAWPHPPHTSATQKRSLKNA